ncbi:MAG: UvrD-helicase domain-containing protein [Coprobacillus sp.]|nr:UvrD-helicase domain-containing protein [Coprobacillus sp.]
MNFEKDLNKEQYEAVTSPDQYVRVIAGAGSGKTRVLTYRIAYLIEECNVDPYNILAISFTNKAAEEMRNRVIKLLPGKCGTLTIRTFHAFAAYVLRQEIGAIGFPSNFHIIDDDDQVKLLKDIAEENGLNRSDPIVKKTISFISTCKLHSRYPEDITDNMLHSKEDEEMKEYYERYEYLKNRQFALDFDDLLLKTIKIFEDNPTILRKWQRRFHYILVDEFQDTNDVEYKLLNLLMTDSTSLYVVGDPDQTIYTWRGTNPRIIVDLDKRYKGLVTITLTQNYRSTKNILECANRLIKRNNIRVEKDLVAVNPNGVEVTVKGSNTARNEAIWVQREIKRLVEKYHYSYGDIAILYRSNYVTINFEQIFATNQIPYQIYGGLAFYKRAEIKDLLAYFNLIDNENDDFAFDRICNVPRRGVGEATMHYLKNEAELNNKSLIGLLKSTDFSHNPNVSLKAYNSLKTLIYRLDSTRKELNKEDTNIARVLENMIMDIGYYEYLKRDDEYEEKLDNCKALFSDLHTFMIGHPDASFSEYLQNIALYTSQDDVKEEEKVSMMTVHTAKGLEFPVVIVVRFNEGVFPHNRSLLEGGKDALEEERRLAYVAFTRAKERLYITYSGDYYGGVGETMPSSFIGQAGLNPGSYDDFDGQGYSPWANKKSKHQREYHFDDEDIYHDYTEDDTDIIDSYIPQVPPKAKVWNQGDRVYHDNFGFGVVLEVKQNNIIVVRFDEGGVRNLDGNHPKVKKVEQ